MSKDALVRLADAELALDNDAVEVGREAELLYALALVRGFTVREQRHRDRAVANGVERLDGAWVRREGRGAAGSILIRDAVCEIGVREA